MCIATTGTVEEQWSPISSRKQLEISTTNPEDLNILWADSTTNPYTLKCYNASKSAWQALASSQFQNAVANFEALPSEGNNIGDIRYVEADGQLYRCNSETGAVGLIWSKIISQTHNHDAEYYSKQQTDSKLSQKSSATHNHAASVVSTVTTGMTVQSYITNFNTNKEDKLNKGKANGYCELNIYGYVPTNRLPALNFGHTYVVSSENEQLALDAKPGEVCVRTDLVKSYIHNGGVSNTVADWTWLQIPVGAVLAVNNQSGIVELNAADLPHDIGATTSNGDITYTSETIGDLINELISYKSDYTHIHDSIYYNKTELHPTTGSFQIFDDDINNVHINNTSPLDGRYYPMDRFRRNGYGDNEDRPGHGALDDRYYVEQEFFGDYNSELGNYVTSPGHGVLDSRYYVKEEFFGNYTGPWYTYNSAPGCGCLDGRYYVKQQLLDGSLDTRYYTKSQVDNLIDTEIAYTIESAIIGNLNMDMRYYT
jgi:hypothetical protein